MKTKAELEAEINDLKVRVAELEGAIAAYRFAIEHANQQQPYVYKYGDYTWNGGVWPQTFPITTFNSSE